MLQKTQWTMAATALAVGACLAATARPAQAQVRIHMSRGSVKTTVGNGIVTPPSTSPVTPAVTSPAPPAPTPTVAPKIKPTPPPLPVVTPPAPVKIVTAPQGFSPGPSLMGEQRLPLGRLVDRVGPAIIGDNGPTVQKVVAHH